MFARLHAYRTPHLSVFSKAAFWLALLTCLFGSNLLLPGHAQAASGCCVVRGNTDCSPDGIVDISDLTRLIDNLFISLDPLCCVDAANTDASPDGIVDISDLTILIDNLYISLNPMIPCGGDLLPFGQKKVVFDGIDSVYQANSGLPLDSLAARLVAYLLTMPDIDTAAIMDSISVWARFSDHTMLSLPNNTFIDDSVASAPPAWDYQVDSTVPANFAIPPRRFPEWNRAAGNQAQRISNLAGHTELPSSIQSRVMCTVSPTCFPSVNTTAMKNLLDNNGYVTTVATGSVPSLFNVRNDGAFLYIGHGGPGMNIIGDSTLSLWTTTVISHSLDSTYAGLLLGEELVYMCMPDYDATAGGCTNTWHYGFTGKFVAQYMSFVANSFVYICACESDSVASLRNGFKLAGASTFAGWSKTVHVRPALKAHEFMFDRLLGANASTLTPIEHPKQRPFDIDLVWQDMKNRGFDTDPAPPGAKLRVRHLQDNFGILAPSLRYMAVVEHFDTLYVTGTFGTDPGPTKRRVYMGGTDMLVYDWQPQLITCFIPNTGAGSVGPATVEVDGLTGPSSSTKRESNVVNLTTWEGIFTYKQDDFQALEGKIEIHAKLRADIHAFRDKPHETPHYYSVIFPAMENSYGIASVSGHAEYLWPGDPPSLEEWDWDGSHYLKGLWENDPTGFLLDGWVDGNTSRLKLHVFAAEARDLIETVTDLPPQNVAVAIPLELSDTFTGYYWIQMNSVWDILGDSRSVNKCCSRDPDGNGTDDIVHTFSWPTIQASWAPDTSAAQ